MRRCATGTRRSLFSNGYLDVDAHFTLSGRSDDYPVSYGRGQQAEILMDALHHVQMAALHNASRTSSNTRWSNRSRTIASSFASLAGWNVGLRLVRRLRAVRPAYRQWQTNFSGLAGYG